MTSTVPAPTAQAHRLGPRCPRHPHGSYPRWVSPLPDGAAVPLKFENATAKELVSIWLAALGSLADLAESLTAAAWSTDSPCPGWTAGDVVAHVLALESELHGVAVPEHEPDWATLPHVTSPFGQYTEVPVDWYRTKGRDVVLAELREIIAWREQDLADVSDDLTATVTGPAGWQTTSNQMFRTRILDTWMHEQDIRAAADQPGGLDSDGAWVTAAQFLSGLPFVWGKSVGAPVGSSLHLTLTGPGVELQRTVRLDDDKRARFVEGSIHDPTLRMTLSWPLYAALSGGRRGAVAQAHNGAVTLEGDPTLATSLLPALATTP